MDASFHYPYVFLNLGRCIFEYHNKVHPSRLAQAIVPQHKQHYVTQLRDAFDAAQQSVEISASAGGNLFRRIMLLPPENDIPRKEVVAVISFVLYVRFLDLHILPTPGTVAKYVGVALAENDELRGQISARHAAGELMDSGKALILELDDSLNIAPTFREMCSLGVTSQEIGASGDEIRERIEKLRDSEKSTKGECKPFEIPLSIQKRMQWLPN